MKIIIVSILIVFAGCAGALPETVTCGLPYNSISPNYPNTSIVLTQEGFYTDNDTTDHIINRVDSCNNYPSQQNKIVFSYPEIARRAGVEGIVKVKMVVNQKGELVSSKIVYSNAELLNQPVLDSLKQIRYSPYRSNCINKVFTTLVSISFTLNRANIN